MSAGSTLDPKLVQQAEEEVRARAAQVARWAAEDLPTESFYQQSLRATGEALAAVSAAAWISDDRGHLQLLATWPQRAAMNAAGEPRQPTPAVAAVFKDGHARVLPPRNDSPLNPTPHLLLVAPVTGEGRVVTVLEVAQRPGAGESAQDGYRRFVQTVCRLAAGYHRRRQQRDEDERRQLWRQALDFAQAAHADLRTDRTSYAVANEGRRLLACDRLSVAVCRGSRTTVEAISGQDTIDPRANLVAALTQLCDAVSTAGERLTYQGDATGLPPQLEEALERYVDLAHCRSLVAEPLRVAQEQTPGSVVGVLVAEQLEAPGFADHWDDRLALLSKHATAAVANALEHDALFLRPLWQWIGKSKAVVAARNLPKTLSVLLVVTAVLLGLLFIPADFTIEAPGVLEPEVQRDVFVRVNGTVQSVLVRNGQQVTAGEVLAELANTDLEVAMTELVGQQTVAQEQLLAIQRALFDEGGRLSVVDQNQLAGQRRELEQRLVSLQQRLALYQQKREFLQVRSPIDGQVNTWDVQERLEQRPVREGQVLMTVADPRSQWQLELRLPEDRVGHLMAARKQSQAEPEVTFMLATEPGTQYRGRVCEIDLVSQVRGSEGSTVLVKVELEDQQLPPLRTGADAVAKVHCGRRSLAYVWLHDLADFIQTRILFRL